MKVNVFGKTPDFSKTSLGVAVMMACASLALQTTRLAAQEAGGAAAAHASAVPADAALSPDEALQKLMAGNKRYVENAPTHPDQSVTRRNQLTVGQHPFAVILGCSDSRVAPEVIFDEGLGDLFVIRVAGNVVDDDGLGSLEYAVEHLHAPLIVVLGHTKCGAVTAAVSGEPVPGHIRSLVQAIKPAVQSTHGQPGDPVELAVKANVQRVVNQLKSSKPILAEHIKNGTLKVVGGRYDLTTGTVELLP